MSDATWVLRPQQSCTSHGHAEQTGHAHLARLQNHEQTQDWLSPVASTWEGTLLCSNGQLIHVSTKKKFSEKQSRNNTNSCKRNI